MLYWRGNTRRNEKHPRLCVGVLLLFSCAAFSADRNQRPAAATLPQAEVLAAITHGDSTPDGLTAPRNDLDASIDKLIGAPTPLHALWNRSHIATESDSGDRNRTVNRCVLYIHSILSYGLVCSKVVEYERQDRFSAPLNDGETLSEVVIWIVQPQCAELQAIDGLAVETSLLLRGASTTITCI